MEEGGPIGRCIEKVEHSKKAKYGALGRSPTLSRLVTRETSALQKHPSRVYAGKRRARQTKCGFCI